MSSMSGQIDKKNDCYPRNDFYSLNRVFGFGSKNNFSLSVNNINGLIAWVSGPYVIFYDLKSDKQISFLKNINNKIISCLKFSKNGKYLATGEGNCKNGAVCIYEINYDNDGSNEEFHKLILEKKIHKYGIDKLLFFKNDRYILSIGNNDDKLMNILDIHNNHNIFTSRFNRPILSSEISDNFMVLTGNGFIKIYKYEKLLNASMEELDNRNLMEKYLIDLGKLRDKAFVSTVIYDYQKDRNDIKIFFMTLDGYLVEMKVNDSKLNRWVHLRSNMGLTLTIWNNMIGCGLSDGIYRVFNADNLSHVLTLQRPPPLGKLNNDSNNKKENINIANDSNPVFADIIATAYNDYHKKLIVIYSDKTFFAWDISQPKNVSIYRYNIFQSGGIRTMDYSISKDENLIKIATCSDDQTVILWNIKLDEFLDNPISSKKNMHITYSKYIRHIFYFCKNFKHLKVNSNDILNKNNNDHLNEDNENFTLTSVRFSPDSNYLAIGDSIGNVFIYSLKSFEQVLEIPTHQGDVNSIDMIKDFEKNETYLTSGGADHFISILDVSDGFSKDLDICNNNIIEKMNSPVINVVFCIDKNRNLKLVTAENNSTITFFLVNNINKSLMALQKFSDDNLKTYCLNYSRPIQKIVSGHNGKITIWKTSSNVPHKHFQVNKGDKLLDNFRIASDSTGVMFATSNNDKIIRIRAFHDGKLLCKIPVSESISSLGFILDDNYLIATSVEGYLYFYKLNQELIQNLKKNNDLINSTEEKKIINNKLKLLQKFMENDASLSKNEELKNLFDKFQRSEETTFEDLKKLNGFVKEGKKKHQDIHEENKINKPKEVIELKEEKPNNKDDQENENNDNENKDLQNDNNIFLLNKSKIFEKELRENNLNLLSRKSIGRISLTDTYKNNMGHKFHFPKIKIIDGDKNNDNNNIDNYNNFDISKQKNIEQPNQNENELNNITFNNLNDSKNLNNISNSIDKMSNGENLIKENYENDKTIKNEKENTKKNINKNDMSKSQLRIMELKDLINNTNNYVNDVDLKVKKENSKINDNYRNESINHNKAGQNDENEIDMDVLDLEDIKLEKKDDDNNNELRTNELNININEELAKKNNDDHETENININIDDTNNYNNLNSIQSSFKGQIIENSRSHISQKNQFLTITQTTLGIKSLINNKNNFELLIPSDQKQISYFRNAESRPVMLSKENDFIITSNINHKDKLMENIKNVDADIDDLKSEDLKEMENKLELLLNKIRIKLGNESEDPNLEKILEKYSMLLLDKIVKLNKSE